MTPTPEIPRTDACPHCGAGVLATPSDPYFYFDCGYRFMGPDQYRPELCREREARQKAEAEVERLKKPRYPFESFGQFCDFLTSNNIADELAVTDPEGWDGGVELSRIEAAFVRVLSINGNERINPDKK